MIGKTNAEIAKALANMATLYQMVEVAFKPAAYQRAAESIQTLDEELYDLWKREGKKGLDKIPGVGMGIAAHIEEILKTGRFKEYEQMKKKFPVDLEGLTAVEGVGPMAVKELWQKLKIKNLAQLEKAVKTGKVRKLPRFGEKSEQNILKGIEFLKRSRGRFNLGEVFPIVKNMEERLAKILGIGKIATAGSFRRRQETIGDIDILVTAKHPQKVIDAFLQFPEIGYIYGKGPTKVNVRLKNGLDADIRVLPEDTYGSGLQYFTGDKTHNIQLRTLAIKKGYKLSEYGLFRGKKLVAGKTEEEIYARLGMATPPPEIRTASGEIEAARAHKLPKLIPYGSIRGDLQVQTSWTDGSANIEEMAKAAMKAGLEYIAITDHTRSLAMTGGLDEKGLERQGKEIDKLNKELGIRNKGFRILKGAEVNILKDGTLDIKDEALKKLDVVGVSVHSHFHMPEGEMTARIIRALKNSHVNIMFHPTGRIIGRREAYKLDIIKVLKAAKEYGVVMEANAQPDRLDLRDAHIKDAIKFGVKLVIDSDAHAPAHFKFLDFGVAQVRCGWGSVKDVLNTKEVEEFMKTLKSIKN